MNWFSRFFQPIIATATTGLNGAAVSSESKNISASNAPVGEGAEQCLASNSENPGKTLDDMDFKHVMSVVLDHELDQVFYYETMEVLAQVPGLSKERLCFRDDGRVAGLLVDGVAIGWQKFTNTFGHTWETNQLGFIIGTNQVAVPYLFAFCKPGTGVLVEPMMFTDEKDTITRFYPSKNLWTVSYCPIQEDPHEVICRVIGHCHLGSGPWHSQ